MYYTRGILPISTFRPRAPRAPRGPSTQQDRPYKSEASGNAKGPNPSLSKGPNDALLL